MSRGYRDRDSGGYRDRDRDSGTRVYVGQLPDDARKEELESEFGHFGRLISCWVARNPPGFAFIEFEDKRDAEDAVAELDGRKLCGQIAKVEIASGRRRGGGGGRRGGYGGGGRGWGGGGGFRDRSNEKCFNCGERGHFARDCRSSSGGGGRGYGGGDRYSGRSYRRSRSRSRSASPRRSYRQSRSKSLSPKD